MPAEDLTLGTPDLRALARRAALPAAAAGALVIAIVVLGGPLQAFADALKRAVAADPRWVVAAAGFELLSFGGYIALLWLVGHRASDRLGLRETTQITLGGAAATRLLPTAGAGGAALTLWALRRSGMNTRSATRTLLTFLVLMYSIFLLAVAVTGYIDAFEGEPLALTALPAAIATLGMVLAVSTALIPAGRGGRLLRAAGVFGEAMRHAIGHVRSFDARLLGAVAWWGFDMAVLYAMLHAFGTPPAFQLVVLAYFLGQIGNTIPIPGAVSGGIVGALIAFGVDTDLAIVSVFAYRAIAIWVPAPIGLVALSQLRRTIAAWGRADTAVVAPEAVVTPQSVVAPDAVVAGPAASPAPSRAARPAWRPSDRPVTA